MKVEVVEPGYLLLLDESRVEAQRELPFLVTGGLLIPLSSVPTLFSEITRIRNEAGYPEDVPLKWHGPPAAVVLPAAHARAKNELLRACAAADAKLFVTLVHVEIAEGAAEASQDVWFGWNTVLRAVNEYLVDKGGAALAQLDRTAGGDDSAFIAEKMERGLIYPASGGQPERQVALTRMAGFSVSSAHGSRIASSLDVPLGALAFCLNPPTAGAASSVGAATGRLVELVQFYPSDQRAKEYRPDYERAIQRLSEHGLGPKIRGRY